METNENDKKAGEKIPLKRMVRQTKNMEKLFDAAGNWNRTTKKKFTVNDGTGEIKDVELSFKEWIQQLCLWGDYEFLLDGYQTGEIFDMHEYFMRGISPDQAAKIQYEEFARI